MKTQSLRCRALRCRALRWQGYAIMASLPLIALGIALSAQRAHAVESTATTNTDNTNPGYHATETLDACMRKWDPGTHMSREAWRASCERIRNERAPLVKTQ